MKGIENFDPRPGVDIPVILNRIRRSNSGGRSGHFGADQSNFRPLNNNGQKNVSN
jgi:hypothetical protein